MSIAKALFVMIARVSSLPTIDAPRGAKPARAFAAIGSRSLLLSSLLLLTGP
jgi:hypothetical protein